MADAEYKRLGCAAEGCDKERQGLGLCAMHYRRLKRTGSYETPVKECANCGCSFSNSFTRAMYCSKRCKMAAWVVANPDQHRAHRESAREKIPAYSRVNTGFCKQCQKPYLSTEANGGVCSDLCRRRFAAGEARLASQKKHKNLAREVACEQCSLVFCPLYGTSHAKLCSVCAQERDIQAKRSRRLARKMRQRVQTVEVVNPIMVFDRDGWRCQLCKKATPRRLRGTHNDRAPELDHIIPVSLGGEHSYRNTQCACRACNQTKSNKPMGQMLLVG